MMMIVVVDVRLYASAVTELNYSIFWVLYQPALLNNPEDRSLHNDYDDETLEHPHHTTWKNHRNWSYKILNIIIHVQLSKHTIREVRKCP
jgi:hypothetical protein